MGLYLGYPGKFVVGYVRFRIKECFSATQRVLCVAGPFRVYTRLHTGFVAPPGGCWWLSWPEPPGGAAVMAGTALREKYRARLKLRSATKYGTKDKLLKNVTKDAIEKAGKTGDLDAKCQAVANAAALEDVEQQRRDAAAAGKTLSTADAEAAFLVAQSQGKDAQQVQERHNAAADQLIAHAEQCRQIGTTRRGRNGGTYRADGDTVREQQANWAAHEEERRARGDTEEEQRAVPDTNHSMGTHVDWVGALHADNLKGVRKYHKSVLEQLADMGIESLGDVVYSLEGGKIVGFRARHDILESWEGVPNPVTTFAEATANAERIRREMPDAPRRKSEMAAEREAAGRPHNCNPKRNGKWNVEFYVGGRSRQIWDPEVREHLLEKGAAVDLRDEYEKHVAKGRNGKCPCARKDRCPWLVPIKPKKRRCY